MIIFYNKHDFEKQITTSTLTDATAILSFKMYRQGIWRPAVD